LIDHEPPVRIETALARAGIVFEKDKQLDLLNKRTGEINLAHAPDEIRFDVEQFNKQVVTAQTSKAAEDAATSQKPELHGTIETTAHGKAEEIVHSLSAREPLTISSMDQNIRTFCC
jgi:type I restriction enzyme, R subunit